MIKILIRYIVHVYVILCDGKANRKLLINAQDLVSTFIPDWTLVVLKPVKYKKKTITVYKNREYVYVKIWAVDNI